VNSVIMQNTCLQNKFSNKHFLRQEKLEWSLTAIIVSGCSIVLNTTTKFREFYRYLEISTLYIISYLLCYENSAKFVLLTQFTHNYT
jgi:hypothetical protein